GSADPREALGAAPTTAPAARAAYPPALSAPSPPIHYRQGVSRLLPEPSPRNCSSLRGRSCPLTPWRAALSILLERSTSKGVHPCAVHPTRAAALRINHRLGGAAKAALGNY